MAFKVHTTDDAGKSTREVRSITGARRAVANDLLKLADALLDDDSLWAGRTQRMQRERIQALNEAARDSLDYDGPLTLTLEGKTWAIEQDADAATREEKRTTNKRTGPKWLNSVRFANDCAGGCGTRIQVGERGYYDAPRLYCEPCGVSHEARLNGRKVAA